MKRNSLPDNPWRNRIISSGVKPASDFLAHELNWKIHPKNQQDGISGSLESVGWFKSVVESARSGKLLDGHARIMLALQKGDETPVPYEIVDVTEEEEAIILATLDPLASLAVADKEKLDALLREMPAAMDTRLQEMLTGLADIHGLYKTGNPLEKLDMEGWEKPGGGLRIIILFDAIEEQEEFWEQLGNAENRRDDGVIYEWKNLRRE